VTHNFVTKQPTMSVIISA